MNTDKKTDISNQIVLGMDHIQQCNKIHGYLGKFNWDKITIGAALIHFELTHGMEKVAALFRYIQWAEAEKKRPGEIATTIGHDLNNAKDELCLPRSGSY